MNIEQIGKAANKVVELEDQIETLKYKIKELSADKCSIDARADIVINNNKRGTYRVSLNIDEVKSIFLSRLKTKEKLLSEAITEYKNLPK